MAELIAQGRKPEERWRRPLPAEAFVLGRDAGAWSVPWEQFLSRRHVTLTWRDGALEVEAQPQARNPVFVRGEAVPRCRLRSGECFVVGATTFTFVDAPPPAAKTQATVLVQERTFTESELKKSKVADAGHQLSVLNHLPGVIARAADERELFIGLINLLLSGVPQAEAVALVEVETGDSAAPVVRILAQDRRQVTAGAVQPSVRLVREAVRRQETVLHVWAGAEASGYTQAAGLDWAFCTPMRSAGSKGWGIYVTGRGAAEPGDAAPPGLIDELKFTDLVAAIWSALQQVNQLKQRQASLSQFFSPAVMRQINEADPEEVLKPQPCDVTVTFCDLRGFSRESEKRELMAMLEGVSKSLGFMTQNILDQGGVIGDFQGDAAMGFWGWPLPQPDRVKRACLAALATRALFEAVGRQPSHPLHGFRVGLGIASGRAVAGKIGTVDQVKVTVFGPVVNLASRLEGMTKILRVPILLDEGTSQAVQEQMPPGLCRLRRIARVRPYGMAATLTVSELLPPHTEDSLLTDAHLKTYEEALDLFLKCDWARAYELLHTLPADDRGTDFLNAFILQHNHTPPPGWDGVIPMTSKS